MYESFFDLNERPFAAALRVDCYFPAHSIDEARQTLIRLVQRAEGPGLLIGPAGVGKSLLCQVIAENFSHEFRTVLLANARLGTRRELLQTIHFELGLPYKNLEEGELRLSLMDYLQPSSNCPHGLLLVVDEADSLPLRLLEEIRMITNFVRNGEPRVHLILAGGAKLEERFSHPRLESFNQRIAARCYLQSLSREETAEYVRAQILRVGGSPKKMFTDDALHTVYRATDGVPRLINQLCDHALILASLGEVHQLDSAGIEEAWTDLQQLPVLWNAAPQAASAETSSVVEFGNFDDDFQESAEEPEQRIEAIQMHLAALEEEEQYEKSETVSREEAEYTLEPAEGFEDPFADDFEEEEIVLDRYASLESVHGPRWSQVTNTLSREISEAIQSAANRNREPLAVAPETWREQEETKEVFERGQVNIASGVRSEPPRVEKPKVASFDPASDPVYPQEETEENYGTSPANKYPAKESASASIAEEPKASKGPFLGGGDDRDLIIVEQDEPTVKIPKMPPAKARRQEYRQLFARLRHG